MVGDSTFRIILGRRGYGFIAALLTVLFTIFFYILTPGNFSSFSDTLRYFISGIATLLAVVVSFNTLALRNQLNNMPTSIEALDRQLDKISNLLQPVINQREKFEEQESSAPHKKKSPTLYYTDAMTNMLQESRRYAESIVKKNYDSNRKQELSNQQEKNFKDICTDFIDAIEKRISQYEKYKSPFYLVIIATTGFVERMRFNEVTYSDEQTKQLFDISKKLHIIRNISVRIFIRNSLTELSIEMLVSTIPIITFTAIISSISNYEQYNPVLLRLLFAASSSIVVMPFLQLFVRTMPVLAVIQGSSSIPFTQKEQR